MFVYIYIYIYVYKINRASFPFGVEAVGRPHGMAKVITLVSYSPLLVMQLVDYWSQSGRSELALVGKWIQCWIVCSR